MFVHHIASNWRRAVLSQVDTALCTYAEKLTKTPDQMTSADLDALRSAGLDDRAIHDSTQIIGYFNYINRVADALGIDQEDFVREWEKPKSP